MQNILRLNVFVHRMQNILRLNVFVHRSRSWHLWRNRGTSSVNAIKELAFKATYYLRQLKQRVRLAANYARSTWMTLFVFTNYHISSRN